MSRVRVVVAGTGFGGRVILPTLAAIRAVELAAICGGPDKAKTERLARRYGIPVWNQSFAEVCRGGAVDLAFIASPHEHHAAMARAALDAGVHIVCEKPLALRPADVTNLVARARRSDQLCLINHQLRFHPAIVSARNAIRSGRIGRCVHVTADYWTNRYVDPAADKRAWWFDRNQGGGMFWAMGTHLADLVRFCLDREPVRIRGCSADTLLPSASGPGGRRFPVTAESMFAALLECGGGTSIILQATGVAFNGASGLSVVFRGDRGELRFDSPGRLTLSDLETRDARGRTLRTPKAGETNVFETAFREFAGVLIRAVRSDRPALLSDACTFQDYAASHQVVSAMRRSAARSRPTTGTRPG